MLFTVDDVNPESLSFWMEHLDPVKRKYPEFKAIAFVTPFWHDKKENHVMVHPDFLPWLKARSDWVSIAAHGLNHLTYECLQPFEKQLEMMKTSKQILETILAKEAMFKPPYYKYNFDSLFAAKEAGFRWFFIQDGILDLLTYNFYPRDVIGLIDSHCNPETQMNDRIDKINWDNFFNQVFANKLG